MSDTLKIGLSLKDDFNSLRKRQDMHPDRGNWIELQEYVGKFGIEDRSLQKIYANLFGEKISKNQRLSNWEADVLSEGRNYTPLLMHGLVWKFTTACPNWKAQAIMR